MNLRLWTQVILKLASVTEYNGQFFLGVPFENVSKKTKSGGCICVQCRPLGKCGQ